MACTRSTARPSSSSEVGSIQCASSQTHQHRLAARQALELADQRLERPLLLPLRAQGRAAGSARRSGSTAARRAAARPRRRRRPHCASRASSLSSLRSAGSSALEAGGPLELVDHRVERAVLVVGRAEVAQAGVRLVAEALAQRLHEARLADARLAGRAARPGPRPPWPAASGRAAAPSSCSRPTSGARRRRRAAPRSGPRRRLGPSTRQARTGSAKPFRRLAAEIGDSNRPPTSRRVLCAITTVPGSASACRRAARLGVSPTTACSCGRTLPTRSPTTTSPVAIPTRTASGVPSGAGSRPTASTIPRPARTARSASSSCAWGSRNRRARRRP